MAGGRHRTEKPGTDWRRFALAGTVGLVLAGGTVAATTATAAVPVYFAVSGSTFTVTADTLRGRDAVQYASVASGTDEKHPVAVASIADATLTNLCQSSVTRTPLGAVTLTIRTGENRSVHARDLVIDLQRLDGDLRFKQVRMGQDASTLGAGPRAQQGAYGQQARRLDIDDVKVRAWSVAAATFELADASMSIRPGAHPCA
ncbi:hypothetical protein GCM10018785_74050 [Streptomyces longispororuber]|uniref:Cholesterol esterase n=1 Tax=Streptomyces longispororuber TaxID=68230 RepID=A0A919ACD6_9ACTN|nr:DUF6230 family protein [Streptomyces longispororuber]GHE99688.1 hypothetical protein GCM10018785_74050 [Streptomyces longispororuber]